MNDIECMEDRNTKDVVCGSGRGLHSVLSFFGKLFIPWSKACPEISYKGLVRERSCVSFSGKNFDSGNVHAMKTCDQPVVGGTAELLSCKIPRRNSGSTGGFVGM